MRAWLIRWQWSGDHAAVDDPVVSVLSARTGVNEVRRYVERRYIEETASLEEMLAYARYNRPLKLPYPAHIENGMIHCGHNPWLHASVVDNLHVEIDAGNNEVLKWDE